MANLSKPLTRAEGLTVIKEACEAQTFALDVGVEPEIVNRLNRVTVNFGSEVYVTFELEQTGKECFETPEGDKCNTFKVKAYLDYPTHGRTDAWQVASRAEQIHRVALWATKVEVSFPLFDVVVYSKAQRTSDRAFIAGTYTEKARKGLRVGQSVTCTLTNESQRLHLAEQLEDGPVSYTKDGRSYRVEKPWDSEGFLLTRTQLSTPASVRGWYEPLR